MDKGTNLRFVDDMVGLKLDGEFYSKLRGEGTHGWQGSWGQHNGFHTAIQVRKGLREIDAQSVRNAINIIIILLLTCNSKSAIWILHSVKLTCVR